MTEAPRRIRVLVVDDSAIVRKVLSDCLSGESDLEVVGTAPDPIIAEAKLASLKPDVLTLDIEMPRMDGITFLKRLMDSHPIPVIVISSLGQASCRVAIEALQNGAVEVLAKPAGPYSVGELRLTLAAKVRAAAAARLRRRPPVPAAPVPPGRAPLRQPVHPLAFIAIGASTGGTEAIQHILTRLPAECPPIAITQHIPAGFSRAFANRLNELCALQVKEAEDGDLFRPGLALVAPGNFHLLVRRSGAQYRAAVRDGPQVCYQRPAVDVLFGSVAEAARASAVGVLLTGMGSDGARGLLQMKQAGAHTIAQDEASSVVFGMPREAIRLGAALQVLPLGRMAQALLAAASSRGSGTVPASATIIRSASG